MLTRNLTRLKTEIEGKLNKDEDDKKTLMILKIIDSDSRFSNFIGDIETRQKSFSAAPDICPACGRAT